MPPLRRRRGRPRVVASQHARRLLAVLGTLLVLATSAFIGAPASQALPRGAYWYSLLDLQKAWKISEGAGVTVAVIDGGVQADLGDLRGQVLPGLDLTGADPGAQHEEPVTQASQFGHGTDMAALIAGTGKGAGLVGVAPKAKILPVDVSSPGALASNTDIAAGVRWSVDHGATVINISLGSLQACPSDISSAFGYAYRKNVIVVVSSGDSPGPVSSPAICPGALAIGAVDSTIKPWSKSSSGPEVDFAAPGYDLVNDLLDNTANGPSPYNSGTSQAAAIASGTFALLRAKFPHDTARQIVTRALYNVHNGLGAGHQGDRAGDALGYGMILPFYALTEAAPGGAKNPIYDGFAQKFGVGSGSGSPSGSASGSASGSGAEPTSGSNPASAASSGSVSHAATGGSGSGGLAPVLIIVIAVVVIGGTVAIITATRRRSAAARARGNPPTAGWGG